MKTLLMVCLLMVASSAHAQTAILTPQGNLICLPGSIVTTCAGIDGGVSILPLGPQTFAITPMAPIQTYQEPKERMELSTPLFFGASEGKPERPYETELPKIPCYSLYRDC